jgi:hypothetical protein
VARAKFRRRLGTVEGLRQRQRGDPAGIGAEEFSDEDIRRELHAAFDELFRFTRRRIAGIGKSVRKSDRAVLIREFRAEMLIAKRNKLLSFRQSRRVLRLRKTLLVQARSSAATPPRALRSALKGLTLC